MPRRPSYSSYSSYLQSRSNDQCCVGGSTITDVTSNADFLDLATRVSSLRQEHDYHINNHPGAVTLDGVYSLLALIDISLGLFTTDISDISFSLTDISTQLFHLETSFSLFQTHFTTLSSDVYEISAAAYGVSKEFYGLIGGDSSHATISAESITVENLFIKDKYQITLSGEVFNIEEISKVAYGVSKEFYQFKAAHSHQSGGGTGDFSISGDASSSFYIYSMDNSSIYIGGNRTQTEISGAYNTVLGFNAGTKITADTSANTLIGYGADISGNVQNSIAIGYGAIVNQSNTIVLGNENTNTILPAQEGYFNWKDYWIIQNTLERFPEAVEYDIYLKNYKTNFKFNADSSSNPTSTVPFYQYMNLYIFSAFHEIHGRSSGYPLIASDIDASYIYNSGHVDSEADTSLWTNLTYEVYKNTTSTEHFINTIDNINGFIRYDSNIDGSLANINYGKVIDASDTIKSNGSIDNDTEFHNKPIIYVSKNLLSSLIIILGSYTFTLKTGKESDNINSYDFSTSYQLNNPDSSAILIFPSAVTTNESFKTLITPQIDANMGAHDFTVGYHLTSDGELVGPLNTDISYYIPDSLELSTLSTGEIQQFLGYTLNRGIPTPKENVFLGTNLGSITKSFANAYINRLVVGYNTIYVKGKGENTDAHPLAITDIYGTPKTWWETKTWPSLPSHVQRLAIQYGIPVNIFSCAAGSWQAKSKYTQFGIEDLITYCNRKNLLGTLNIKPDITFTFFNKFNIIDSYLATYQAGLLGPAINIFMNSIDFNIMDNIIDNKSLSDKTDQNYIDQNDYNIDLGEVNFNEIYKLGVPSMTRPSYFKIAEDTSNVILNSEQLYKYKSIIYGGIEYEQIAIAIEAIYQNRNDYDRSTLSYLESKRAVLMYYVDPNYNTYHDSSINGLLKKEGIYTWDSYGNIIIGNSEPVRVKTTFDQCYNDISNNGELLNNLIYEYKDSFSYSYGNIMFFRSHPRVNRIFLPSYIVNYNPEKEVTMAHENGTWYDSSLNYYYKLYDSSYDSVKKKRGNNEYENSLLDIVLIPLSPGTDSNKNDGKIGIPMAEEFASVTFNPSSLQASGSNTKDEYMRSPGESSQIYWTVPSPKIYTILCGLNDFLTIEYFKYINARYSGASPSTNRSINDVYTRIYLCYYDGTSSAFIKSLIDETGSATTLATYTGIKKIVPSGTYDTILKSYNSINQSPDNNFIDRIENFVYNINEGKSIHIETIQNNSLSYLSGYIITIDLIILIYLTQRFYSDIDATGNFTYMGDFKRIMTSEEIFSTYYNILNNDWKDKIQISDNLYTSSMETLLTDILYNSRYSSINNKDSKIYDLSNDIIFNSSDKDLTITERFFINISKIIKRDINTWNQKSYYKILELQIPSNITNGVINSAYTRQTVLSRLGNIESYWIDTTYKYYIKNDNYMQSFNHKDIEHARTNHLNNHIGKLIKSVATGFKLENKSGNTFPYYKSNTFGSSYKKYIDNIISINRNNLTNNFPDNLVTRDILIELSNNNYINSSIDYNQGYQQIISNYLNTVDYNIKPINLSAPDLVLFQDASYINSQNIGYDFNNPVNVSTMPTELLVPDLTSIDYIFTNYWDKFLDYGPTGEQNASNSLLDIMATDISNTLYYFIDLSGDALRPSFITDNSGKFFFADTILEDIETILYKSGETIDIRNIIHIILSLTLSRYQFLKLKILLENNANFDFIKFYTNEDIRNSIDPSVSPNDNRAKEYKVTYTLYDLYKIKPGFPIDQRHPYSSIEINDILKLYQKIFISINSDLQETFNTIDNLVDTIDNSTDSEQYTDFYRFLKDLNNINKLFESQIVHSDQSIQNDISNLNFWIDERTTPISNFKTKPTNDFLYLNDEFRSSLFNDWTKFVENKNIINI